MSNKIEITKIHSIFHHNHRNYILFSTNHSQFDYLYFKHMKKNIRSLFFGNNFQIYISNLIEKNDVALLFEMKTVRNNDRSDERKQSRSIYSNVFEKNIKINLWRKKKITTGAFKGYGTRN